MQVDPLLLHAIVLAGIIAGAYAMHLRTLRIQARFNLYRVRDRFVLLVADDPAILDQGGAVFAHYYGRINRLLQEEKPMGIDDILQTVFHKFKPGDFERMLEQARRQAERLATDVETRHPAVRAAVADYYASVEMLILSHSSLLRAGWVISRHYTGRALTRALAPYASGTIRRGWAAVSYADKEARAFSPG